MPLPNDPKAPFPGAAWQRTFDRYAEHAAWYSGDPMRLAEVYGSRLDGSTAASFFMNYNSSPNGYSRFWGRQVRAERRTMLHMPIAGDISATSSSMLFAEHPQVRIPSAFGDSADMDSIEAQNRLIRILNADSVYSKLLQASETCSAMGGVVIKINWDRDLADHPILSVAQVDNALPEFTHGRLTACTFFRVLHDDGSTQLRLVEHHERGAILNALYRGTHDQWGIQIPLDSLPETKDIAPVIETGISDLLCRYIPNMRPNRQDRGSELGQSDYSGAEGMMDSLDECWTSLIRDIRLGQGRIIAPESFLDVSKDASTGETFTSFDLDREAYVGLNSVADSGGSLRDQITLTQFEIRTEQHLKAANEIVQSIVTNAGYAPQTFGLQIEGRADSGTALNVRERKSLLTTSKKAEYWRPAVEDLLDLMLRVDALHLGSGVVPMRPVVEIQEGLQSDTAQLAKTIELLARAKAASVESRVRMLHPDWNHDQVQSEACQIVGEQGQTA